MDSGLQRLLLSFTLAGTNLRHNPDSPQYQYATVPWLSAQRPPRQDRGVIERQAIHSTLQGSSLMKLWHQIIPSIAATFISSLAGGELLRRFCTICP